VQEAAPCNGRSALIPATVILLKRLSDRYRAKPSVPEA